MCWVVPGSREKVRQSCFVLMRGADNKQNEIYRMLVISAQEKIVKP